MNWLDLAKTLPLGHKLRSDCPECGLDTNTNAAIINHNLQGYSLYCNACSYNPFSHKGKQTLAELAELRKLNEEAQRHAQSRTISLPEDTSYDISDFSREGRTWLWKAGITPKLISKYSIGYSKVQRRVVLPVYQQGLKWYQNRAVYEGQKPKYLQPNVSKNVVFNGDTVRSGYRVIIVEDILSAIRVFEASGISTVSILGTKLSDYQTSLLSEASMVITWLDGDRAGRKGAASIRKTLSMLMEVGNIVTEKDPKCYSDQQIRKIIGEHNDRYSTS